MIENEKITIVRKCPLTPKEALSRVVLWFEANEYERVAQSSRQLNLFYRRQGGHRLSIRSDGENLSFEFSGDLGSEPQVGLMRRIDMALMDVFGSVDIPASTRRCHACGTNGQSDDKVCTVCGTPL